MSESKEPKIFDNWVTVECNECEHYWNNTCDGVKCDVNTGKALSGPRRPCNSFLPTRSVVIPAKIKSLQKSVRSLWFMVVLITALLSYHILVNIFGG